MFDVSDLQKHAERLGKIGQSIHFAGAVAINWTANQCRTAALENLEKTFTLRNTFYKRFGVKTTQAKAEDAEPFAEVYVPDKELAEQELGETRTVVKGHPAIPLAIYEETRATKAKVIPRQLRASQLLAAQKAIRKGIMPFRRARGRGDYIFIRKDRERYPIIPLYQILPSGPYKIKKRPWFLDTVAKTYDKNLEENYNKAMDKFVFNNPRLR